MVNLFNFLKSLMGNNKEDEHNQNYVLVEKFADTIGIFLVKSTTHEEILVIPNNSYERLVKLNILKNKKQLFKVSDDILDEGYMFELNHQTHDEAIYAYLDERFTLTISLVYSVFESIPLRIYVKETKHTSQKTDIEQKTKQNI